MSDDVDRARAIVERDALVKVARAYVDAVTDGRATVPLTTEQRSRIIDALRADGMDASIAKRSDAYLTSSYAWGDWYSRELK